MSLAPALLLLLPAVTFAAADSATSAAAPRAQEPSALAVASDRYFEFHSGFWINLHFFLYEEAVTRSGSPDKRREAESTADSSISGTLSGNEKSDWDAAVAYYEANFISLNLLTNDRMRTIKNALENSEGESTLSQSRLDPRLIRILQNAASVYRAHWWPAHDRANRDWISTVMPLVDSDGNSITQDISQAYETPWPNLPIRVDIAAYANSSGAFTTLLPTRIAVSSQDPGNQKMNALEVLFHEASHAMVEKVGNMMIQDFAAHRRNAPPDLLHAMLYFTTGYFVKQLHPDYVTYADQTGLWKQTRWPAFESALVKDWQPHLQGESTASVAISQLVSDFLASSR